MVQLRIHPSPSNHTIVCPAELRACRPAPIRSSGTNVFVLKICQLLSETNACLVSPPGSLWAGFWVLDCLPPGDFQPCFMYNQKGMEMLTAA